jgi:hypothetical protein
MIIQWVRHCSELRTNRVWEEFVIAYIPIENTLANLEDVISFAEQGLYGPSYSYREYEMDG